MEVQSDIMQALNSTNNTGNISHWYLCVLTSFCMHAPCVGNSRYFCCNSSLTSTWTPDVVTGSLLLVSSLKRRRSHSN